MMKIIKKKNMIKWLLLIIFFLVTVIIIVFLKNNIIRNNTNASVKKISKEIIKKPKDNDKYIDTNPIKVGLYIDKKLTNSYNDDFTIYTDIVSIECYYTNDDYVNGNNFLDIWNKYYSSYTDIDDYKIGYHIKFTTTDKEVDNYIYRPSDVDSFFDYVQVYLYDDIHQQNATYYDHIKDSEYDDNTLLTSIKLTASRYIDKITSNIVVTVFTYKNTDIIDGVYVGNSKYQVSIEKRSNIN